MVETRRMKGVPAIQRTVNSLPVTSARNRRRTADLQASIFSIQLRKYREQTSNSNQEGIADEDICVSYREDEKRKIDSLIKRDKKRDEQNDKLLADSFGRMRTQKISLPSMKVKYPGKYNWKKKGEVEDKEEGAPKDPKSPKRFRSLGQIERESDRLENEEAGVLKEEVVLSLGEEWHGRMKDFHDLISLFVKQDEKAGYVSVLAPYLPKIKEDVKKLEVSKRKKKKVAERRKNLDHGRSRFNAVFDDFNKKKKNLK